MSIEINDLLSSVHSLIMLVLPAVVFQLFFTLKVSELSKSISILTFVGSFVLSLPFQFIPSEGNWKLLRDLIIVAAAAASGFILRLILQTSFIRTKIFNQKMHLENTQNPWNGISDIEYGCYVTVFLKDSPLVYSGALFKSYSDDDDTSWIVLSNFMVFQFCKEELFKDDPIVDYRNDKTRQVSINASEILSVHISYDEHSSKIQVDSKK